MADTTNKLPEGTDTVIEAGGTGGSTGGTGRSSTAFGGAGTSSATNSTGGRTSVTTSDSQTDSLITGTSTSDDDGSASNGGIRGMVSNVTGKAKDEALGRARGFVGEGLKSGSTTLGSIAGIIEDTVEQIGERLGPQYGDYAKSASSTIQRYASTLESKDPDELVDDARALSARARRWRSPARRSSASALFDF